MNSHPTTRPNDKSNIVYIHTYIHPFNSPFPGLPRWAGSRKVKPIWISLKQETVSGSGISWAICKSVPHSRQMTTPAPHHSVFYRPDALPATQPTASKHWRHYIVYCICNVKANLSVCVPLSFSVAYALPVFTRAHQKSEKVIVSYSYYCQIQIRPIWCHCHSLSLASVKSRLVLPFWYRPTWVVPEKGPLNVCVCVCVCARARQIHILLYWIIVLVAAG